MHEKGGRDETRMKINNILKHMYFTNSIQKPIELCDFKY